MTLVAVPVSIVDPAEADRALRRAEESAERGADLIEWRFDAIADDPDARPIIRSLIEHSPKPAIVTVRAVEEGGVYDGTDVARAEFTDFLGRLSRPPRYVDWELATLERSAALRGAVHRLIAAGDHTPRLIVSIHDFRGRPENLSSRLLRAHAYDLASVVKVAWRARSVGDALEAFELLAHRTKPMIALCMGEPGIISRVLAPRFGGFLTFASSTDSDSSAPGQPTLDALLNCYRFRSVGPDTALYGVIGWPVAQSKGPVLHNEAFRRAGFDAVYLPMPVAPEFESLKASLASLLEVRVDGRSAANLRGASVTIPHKESLLRFGEQRGAAIDGVARDIGAANTIAVRDDGTIFITNTDGPAICDILSRAWCDRAGWSDAQLRIIGSGGVARAAAWAGVTLGAHVEIAARNHRSADALVSAMRHLPGARIERVDEHAGRGKTPLVIINATPVGMRHGPDPDGIPFNVAHIHPGDIVFDTVYHPEETPLLRAAAHAGARCIAGSELFLGQAARQFTVWTGASAPAHCYAEIPV